MSGGKNVVYKFCAGAKFLTKLLGSRCSFCFKADQLKVRSVASLSSQVGWCGPFCIVKKGSFISGCRFSPFSCKFEYTNLKSCCFSSMF